MTPETGMAFINGANLYYEILGNGTPLVLLHAGIADRRMWDAQFEVFAQHFRVVRYDRRGFGNSPMVAGDFSHRRDLVALLHHLNMPKAHFVGASYGGRTILDFALEQPEMVLSLVTVGSSPGGFSAPQFPPPPQIEAIDQAASAGDIALASELEIQLWVDGPTRTPDQLPAAIRQLAVEMNLIALQYEIQALGDDQPFMDTVSRLSEIHAPSLIIWGDIDRPHVSLAGEFLAAQIVGAKKHIMTGTAHLPNMERPQEFNEVVLDFLKFLP